MSTTLEGLRCKECGPRTRSRRATSASSASGRSRSPTTSAGSTPPGEAEDPGRPARHLALRRLPPLRRAARAIRCSPGSRRSSAPTGLPSGSGSARSGSRTTPPTRPTRSRTGWSPWRSRRRRSSAIDTVACASTGNLANAVAAHAAARGPRLVSCSCPPTSRSRSCSRPVSTAPTWSACAAATTTSTGSAPSSARRGPGRSSTSTSARTTPRARRRSPTRRSSSSAGRSPTGSSARSPRGRCSRRSAAGFASGSTSGWSRASCRRSTAPRPRAATRSPRRTPTAGTSASRSARRRSRRASRSETPPTGRTRSTSPARPAGRSRTVDDAEIRAGIRLLAETTGIFTETAGGVTTAVLAKLAEAGAIGSGERVVVIITGEGLKTLDAAREGYSISEIEPSLESFEAGVAAAAPAGAAR